MGNDFIFPSKKSHEECRCIDSNHTYMFGKHMSHILANIIYSKYIEDVHRLLYNRLYNIIHNKTLYYIEHEGLKRQLNNKWYPKLQ